MIEVEGSAARRPGSPAASSIAASPNAEPTHTVDCREADRIACQVSQVSQACQVSRACGRMAAEALPPRRRQGRLAESGSNALSRLQLHGSRLVI